MSVTSKVVWREGMLLRPQHFQQQERHYNKLISRQLITQAQYYYGFYKLKINQLLLDQGKIVIQHAEGVFPDGTMFSFPEEESAPSPLIVPENVRNTKVYLCIPLHLNDEMEIQNSNLAARYKSKIYSLKDNVSESAIQTDIEIANLQTCLLLEEQDRSCFSCLPLLEIKERRPDHKIYLNNHFIPPYLNISTSIKLTEIVQELYGLLQHRAEVLAYRLAHKEQSESASIVDLGLLQLTNRYESIFSQYLHNTKLHPETLYKCAQQLLAEISTFTKDSRRPECQTAYCHDDCYTTFHPLMKSLRNLLNIMLEQHAIAITLIKHDFGVYVAEILDGESLDKQELIIGVAADLDQEMIRQTFQMQVKIAPVTLIKDLVSRGLPGLSLQPLTVIPRQIPYHVQFVYFRLDQQHAMWNEIKNSGSICLHVGGHFPNLRLELWSIHS